MSSILRKDKIGNLSHSAGNILLAPSILTIGGRQYETTSTLSVALPVMTANTRYQVYAVQTAGVVSLVISQNENSVGPAGYGSWKLVGSLMANYLGNFGAFIRITGIPISDIFDNGPTTIQATSGGASKGTIVNDVYRLQMKGEFAYLEHRYQHGAAGAGGTGSYLLDMPINVPINTSKTGTYVGTLTAGAADVRGAVPFAIRGQYYTNVGTTSMTYSLAPIAFSSTQFRLAGGWTDAANTSTWGSSVHGFANTNLGMNGWIEAPITGWSNTPIEDR